MNVKKYDVRGKQVTLPCAEVEIIYNDEKHKVEMRQLTYGELNDLREDCLDIKFVGKQSMVKVSQKKWKELGILKSLVKAPFKIELASIQALNKKSGSLLEETFETLNSEDEKKSTESNSTSTDS